jgi:adenosylmethionine-8-amino-7-oxononanoate aminotransferase
MTSQPSTPTTDLAPIPAAPVARADSAALRATARRHLWMPYSLLSSLTDDDGPKVMVRAEGVWQWDSDGKAYIDGVGALEAMVAGHNRREINEAIERQLRQIAFTDTFRYATDSQIALAERLATLAPGSLNRVHFTPGGSEAVDVALKIARQYHYLRGDHARTKVITRHGAYHGVTFGAMMVDGNYHATRNFIFQPESAGRIAPMPQPGCGREHAAEIEALILRENPATVSVVHLDPMNTAIGINIPGDDFLPALREVCDRYGVLLSADEIITGCGRTGRWFACQHTGVVPDLMTLSKGLSSGYLPVGATLVKDEIAALFDGDPERMFRHGQTYGGHPVSCAAALATLDLIEREGLVERAATMGAYILEGLRSLAHHPSYVAARGKGMLLGLELRPHAPERFATLGQHGTAVRLACREAGVIIIPVHPGNAMLIAPPYIMTHAEADEMIARIDRGLTAVENAI